jgi:hypothetical protein
MTINAYPLQWPTGWKRFDTTKRNRLEARFGRARQRVSAGYIPPRSLTLNEAIERALAELQRMAIDKQDVVISTNVPTRLDGLPRSGLSEPGDPGVAVYWQESNGKRRVMAIDLYDRVADNLAAVAATLDAMRAIERHGGAAILERAFTGFTALPAPSGTRNWWDVLQVPKQSTREAVKTAYRALASKAHPDKPGGSHERMAELNAAQEEAFLECAS